MSSRSTRYRLIKPIATGGTAEIWKAQLRGPVGFHKYVVLKRLHGELKDAGDGEYLDRIVSEAHVAAQLSHDNIVQVFDFGLHDGRGNIDCFIAMEYIRGVTVKELLADAGPLGEDLVLFIAHEIARGLAYAHDAKDHRGRRMRLVHRDLAPANVLLSTHGQVKISDFGLAKFRRSITRPTEPGVIKGRTYYMSPEQARSDEIGAPADLFSYGLILYEMSTGIRFFDGSPEEIYDWEGPTAEQIDLLPKTLRGIVRMCLAPLPEMRGDAADFERVLITELSSRLPDARAALAEEVTRVFEAKHAEQEEAEEAERRQMATVSETDQPMRTVQSAARTENDADTQDLFWKPEPVEMPTVVTADAFERAQDPPAELQPGGRRLPRLSPTALTIVLFALGLLLMAASVTWMMNQ